MNRRKKYEKERNLKRLADRRKSRMEKDPPKITENGRRIRAFMFRNNVKGNYKDFVLIAGNTLIDCFGSYSIVPEDNKEAGTVSIEGVALIHKSDLKNIINEDMAKRFWHPRLGRVGAFIKPGTKKNCTNI